MDLHTQPPPCDEIWKPVLRTFICFISYNVCTTGLMADVCSSGTYHAENERSISARVTGCIDKYFSSKTSKSERSSCFIGSNRLINDIIN
ncbi:hypothetical protein V1477_018647 [Vespula maculifrons]|uniref:Uncharacterized protein n=1 Tax=Vespula maculifrons TaxID=7453 RepID=A0ABD2AVZ1_VESMC